MEQAATLATSGLTALQALRDVAKVQPGQTVLITGASGGVGSFAVQTGARAWSRLSPHQRGRLSLPRRARAPPRRSLRSTARVNVRAGCLGVVAVATWRCRSHPTRGTRRRGPARGTPDRLPRASRGRCPGRPIRRWLRCLVRGWRRRRGRDRARRWCRAGGDEAVGEHADVDGVDVVEEGAVPPFGPVPGSGRHARSEPLAARIL